MSEDDVLRLKDAEYDIFSVMVGGRYGTCVGQVIIKQVKEAAKFVREKWGCEPTFFYECSYGWLEDKDGNHYRFKRESEEEE